MKSTNLKVLILEDMYYRAGQYKDRLAPLGITDITHITNARECIENLKKIKYDLVSLDYHLDQAESYRLTEDNKGTTVVQWIKDHPEKVKKSMLIIIHSCSEKGALEMKTLLPNAHVIRKAWHKDVFGEVAKILKLK
ncbi:MAG: cyclic-phosphate processing receiver domain-containing protein [bacterium]